MGLGDNVDNINFKIKIPSDSDGFILLQCPLCSEYFKLTAKDIQSDDNLEICCPFCGKTSDNYYTKDILELGQTIAMNFAIQEIHKEFKKMERQTKNGLVQFKAGKTPTDKYEKKLNSKTDDLVIDRVECCKKELKISYLTKMCGYYCPFCGVIKDGTE